MGDSTMGKVMVAGMISMVVEGHRSRVVGRHTEEVGCHRRKGRVHIVGMEHRIEEAGCRRRKDLATCQHIVGELKEDIVDTLVESLDILTVMLNIAEGKQVVRKMMEDTPLARHQLPQV
jgi:hypothetical protein